MQIDSTMAQKGQYAFMISSDPTEENPDQFTACTAFIPAQYAGKQITLKGFMKSEGIPEKVQVVSGCG